MRIVNQHFINGAFVASHGEERFDLINPATEQILGHLVLGDELDARRAIEAAKGAFAEYSRSTLSERRGYLKRIEDAIAARADDLASIMIEEFGAASQFASFGVDAAIKNYTNAIKLLDDLQLTRSYGSAEVLLKPVGVAGLITPWNINVISISQKLASALAAGCTVVIKPSEFSGLQAQMYAECIAAADLPAGVVNLVHGSGDVVGNELTTNPDVAKISFTGSTRVGKMILRNAADTMKRVTLELGGKSAHIVLDDADLEKAIPFALSSAFMNSGQACIAGSRLLVPESRLDEVKQVLETKIKSFTVGAPADADTLIGPMVSQRQFDRVQGYIRKGIEQGATILVGGEGRPEGLEEGFYVKPTVFIDVTNDMVIAQEEIFGPVLSVLTYKDEEAAVSIANDSSYGLFGWVSSSDPVRGKRMADRIEAGAVFVNDMFDPFDIAEVPFGGYKQSGLGYELGLYGIEQYLQSQSIFVNAV